MTNEEKIEKLKSFKDPLVICHPDDLFLFHSIVFLIKIMTNKFIERGWFVIIDNSIKFDV